MPSQDVVVSNNGIKKSQMNLRDGMNMKTRSRVPLAPSQQFLALMKTPLSTIKKALPVFFPKGVSVVPYSRSPLSPVNVNSYYNGYTGVRGYPETVVQTYYAPLYSYRNILYRTDGEQDNLYS